MRTPIETVTAFCEAFSTDHGKTAVRQFFTSETVWINEGISKTIGIEAAVASLEAVEKAYGIQDAHFDILAIAADGNRVLTERLDRFERADGTEIGASKVMGIFEIANDRIAAWRDYYDVRAAETWPK